MGPWLKTEAPPLTYSCYPCPPLLFTTNSISSPYKKSVIYLIICLINFAHNSNQIVQGWTNPLLYTGNLLSCVKLSYLFLYLFYLSIYLKKFSASTKLFFISKPIQQYCMYHMLKLQYMYFLLLLAILCCFFLLRAKPDIFISTFLVMWLLEEPDDGTTVQA